MNIGYKKLRHGYIAKLQILELNNEGRMNNIVNKEYAKYRCSSAKVLSIFHNNLKVKFRNGPSTIRVKKESSLYNKKFIYEIGEIVECEYDDDIEIICGAGIHYFKSLERAQYWDEKDNISTGIYKEWNDDGTKSLISEYRNGKLDGKHQIYLNNELCSEHTYKEGKLDGPYIFMLGKLKHIEGLYKNGLREGKYKKWHSNGRKHIVCFYKKGVYDGVYKELTSDGRCRHNFKYKNGVRDWSIYK